MTDVASEMEADSALYKTLLESTRAIPWKIDWNSMSFSYIGPQIEGLLGWSPSSWQCVDDWVERMHPDDREATVNFCVAQSEAGIDHEADYRALTKDGGYVWIRDVVHVVRKDGEVDALVGFMFDISERKGLEESLQQAIVELKETNSELQAALDTIKTIGDIIPLCAWCGHKIKNDNDEWISVEKYIMHHTKAKVSHGMCPGCKNDFLTSV